MALRERAAIAVFAGEADTVPLDQQRPERQRLGSRPVDILAGLEHPLLCLELANELAVDVEAVRHRGQRSAHLTERVDTDARLHIS